MRRLLALGALFVVVAGCAGAGASSSEVETDCAGQSVDCVLLGVVDVVELWPVEATFRDVEVQASGSGSRWCEAPVAAPLETSRKAIVGDETAGSATWAVVTTVDRFEPEQAEAFLDVVKALPKGCEWEVGSQRFQYLGGIELRRFADQSAAALLRVHDDGGDGQNVELLLVRSGDEVATVTLVPALDRPALLDTLGDVVASRLESRG